MLYASKYMLEKAWNETTKLYNNGKITKLEFQRRITDIHNKKKQLHINGKKNG